MHPKKKALALIATLASFLTLASEYNSTLAQPSEAFISVPLYRQVKNYYCGPADVEMVFDFYGPDVPQWEIADVARTAPDPDGTYTFDMVRAAHFSNLSTSVGREIPDRNITGYTARKFGYVAFEQGGMTIDDLRSLVAGGYPIVVLMGWHYRVVVGYNTTHIITNDSLGPKFNNMTYLTFDANWVHWGLFVSPWNVKISVNGNFSQGENFTVTANITYPCPPPFPSDQYPATMVNVTITVPDGLSLAPGETSKKTLGTSNLAPRESATVEWPVQADRAGRYNITVEAEGKIEGFAPPIPWLDYPEYYYEDRIGGSNQSTVIIPSEKVGDLGGGVPPQFFAFDGKVDGTDLALFIQCYKGLAPPEAMYLGDLGGPVNYVPTFFAYDGKVDGYDLALFMQCYKGLGP